MADKKYGQSAHPLWETYKNMRRRCLHANSKWFKNYGGRGITICPRWLEPNGQGFKNFAADMGDRPDGMTVERIDNALGYSPDNCRWASRREQANNTRQARLITFQGKTLSVAAWARETGIKRSTLDARLNVFGLSVERALTKGVRRG